MQKVSNGARSNARDESRVRVISAGSGLSWVRPADGSIFNLTDQAELPEITFEIRGHDDNELSWSWDIEWEAKVSGLKEQARKNTVLQTFNLSGSLVARNNSWVVEFSGEVLGGRLTVGVTNGRESIKRTVTIKGVNPSKELVAQYIAELEDMEGFEKLLEQETNTKHFINLDGEPIAAFDKGYGITQMTNPAPSYEQVWNWKANILGGSAIYKEKVAAAKKYLGQKDREYTDDQLKHEIFSRWNGGVYHQWDEVEKVWVRKRNLLCDSATGNIGWSMNKVKNEGKTEAELRERDKEKYKDGSKGQSADHPWQYSGVCYADHVLKE